jgi:hypothetical protein
MGLLSTIGSKIKSAVTKGVSNLRGNLSVIGDSVKKSLSNTKKTAAVMDFPASPGSFNIKNEQVKKDLATYQKQSPISYTPSIKERYNTSPQLQNVYDKQSGQTSVVGGAYNNYGIKPTSKSGGSSKTSTATSSPATTTGLNQSYTISPAAILGLNQTYNPQGIVNVSNTPITTSDISASNVPTVVPSAPANQNYVGWDAKSNAVVEAGKESQTQEQQELTDSQKMLKDFMKDEPERVEVPRELQKAQENAQKQALEIKSQINMINAGLESNLQQLRQVGSQEGVTEAVYGGQQLQLNREAAIKLMPLTASYQAAVDNYNAAKDIVKDWVTQENAYLDKYTSWKNSIFEKAYNYAVGKEKQAIEEARYKSENAREDAKNRRNELLNLYEMAADNGDKNTMSSISQLIATADTMDSDTYNAMYGNALSKVQPKVSEGQLTTRQNINLASITNKYQADETIKAAQSAVSAVNLANKVIADPSKAGNQLTILYTFIKSLDPNSAVREGELSLATNTQSYLSRFKTALEKISQNKGISDAMTIELANATKELASQWTEAAQRRDNFYKSQANVLGVGDVFNEYLQGTRSPSTTTGYVGDEIDSFLDSI